MHPHHHRCRVSRVQLRFNRDNVWLYKCEQRIHAIGVVLLRSREAWLPRKLRASTRKGIPPREIYKKEERKEAR
jgi:hypothetical protein